MYCNQSSALYHASPDRLFNVSLLMEFHQFVLSTYLHIIRKMFWLSLSTVYTDHSYTLSYMIHTGLAARLSFPEKIIQILFPHHDQRLGGVAQGHGWPGPGGGGVAGRGQAEVGQGHWARPPAHVGGGRGSQGQWEVGVLGQQRLMGTRPEACQTLRENSKQISWAKNARKKFNWTFYEFGSVLFRWQVR